MEKQQCWNSYTAAEVVLMPCCCAHFPSEWCFCEIEVLLRTPRRPRQPLWEALALDEALGGCEKLMKAGYPSSREVSCAQSRMQQLKDCNYSVMVEFDWIRATATGWDLDRRPGNGCGLDIISLSRQLKTNPVNTLLLLLHFPQYSRSGRHWCTGKNTFVHLAQMLIHMNKHSYKYRSVYDIHTYTHSLSLSLSLTHSPASFTHR